MYVICVLTFIRIIMQKKYTVEEKLNFIDNITDRFHSLVFIKKFQIELISLASVETFCMKQTPKWGGSPF